VQQGDGCSSIVGHRRWTGLCIRWSSRSGEELPLGLGAEVSAIFTSILTTGRKRGENLLDAFRAVAGPSLLQAASALT